MAGRLIVFEGIDGAGKTTHAERLREHLAGKGARVELRREPGGTALGEEVRRLLLNHRGNDLAPETELLLYLAARAQLLQEVVRPALASGTAVLLDRYFYSTAAYQGAGRGIGTGKVLETCVRLGFEVPDHVFLLDIDPDAAFRRISGARDRIEARGIEYFRTVRAAFLEFAAFDPKLFTVLDAARPIDEVQSRIRSAADSLS